MESSESSHQYDLAVRAQAVCTPVSARRPRTAPNEQLLQEARSATPTDWCPVSSTVVDAHKHASGSQKGVSTAWRSAAFRRIDRQDVPGFRCAGPLALLAIAGRNTH